jgi:hypothetical protein
MIDNNEVESCIIIVIILVADQQECRGRSPLAGFGVSPITSLFAAGGKKKIADYKTFCI